MTAPTINGTRYPQPVDALLPAARNLTNELGELPSRNRLMREFRIGAPKADELRTRLTIEHEQQTRAEQIPTALIVKGALLTPQADHEADPMPLDYAEPIGPHPAPAAAASEHTPVADPTPTAQGKITPAEAAEQVTKVGHPDTRTPSVSTRPAVVWPVILLALPAFVAIWSGWVGLGGLTGFGVVHPLPGIADGFSLNTAITLPIGVETYGAYALYVWLSGRVPDRAHTFAKWSAIASLAVGALGQIAYHLLVAPPTGAPWWITTAVSVLPVAVLGMGAALAHLVRAHD